MNWLSLLIEPLPLYERSRMAIMAQLDGEEVVRKRSDKPIPVHLLPLMNTIKRFKHGVTANILAVYLQKDRARISAKLTELERNNFIFSTNVRRFNAPNGRPLKIYTADFSIREDYEEQLFVSFAADLTREFQHKAVQIIGLDYRFRVLKIAYRAQSCCVKMAIYLDDAHKSVRDNLQRFYAIDARRDCNCDRKTIRFATERRSVEAENSIRHPLSHKNRVKK